MKRDMKRARKHLKEYKAWVLDNRRFPTSIDKVKFSTGTLMYTWRRNNLDIVEEFEKDITPIINAEARVKATERKDQLFFERKRSPLYDGPDTIAEYLKGNNRYIYGDLMTYISIMTYIGEGSELIPYLKLLTKIFRECYTWKHFHHDFNIATVIDRVDDMVDSTLDGNYLLVIYHRFGIKGHETKTLQELADMLGVNIEAIRSLEATALRKLAHPLAMRYIKRAYSELEDVENHGSMGHWFVLYDATEYNHIIRVVNKPVHELEEALEHFNCDCFTNDSEYTITSVNTVSKYSWDIPTEVFMKMDIPQDLILKRIMYNYTTVTVTKVPPKPSFEDFLDGMRNEAKKIRLQQEAIDKARRDFIVDYGVSIQDYNTFTWVFDYRIRELLYNRWLDSEYKWIEWFNNSIMDMMIPAQYYNRATELLERQLTRRLEEYHITCVYSPYNDDFYTLQIRRR